MKIKNSLKGWITAIVIAVLGLVPMSTVHAAQDLFTKACDGASDSAVCDSKAEGASRQQAATQIQGVINLILYILGIAAVVMIVLGGFRYVFSNGDPGAAKQGRDTVIYAAAGLVVAILAFAIVNFFVFKLQGQ